MKEPGFFGDTLPEGVPAELTVGELEEMACRQQQQIESQRQLLAAKEQRLRFLKQHEAKHQLVASEHERLRRLRDKVETQEQKLRKLRALRGQVDQTKLNNVSLTSDLESIRSLFNEKEKELSIAVAKVEELTRQLEDLQRGRDASSHGAPSAAAIELEKLRAELLYRNKLNEQHSARLTHQRELLAQRQEEMAAIDRRIAELQERLHRKRLLNQQLAHHINKQQSHDHNNQKVQLQQLYPQPVNQPNQSVQQQKPNQPLMQLQQQRQQQQKLHQMLQIKKQQQQQQTLQQSMLNHVNASNKNMQLKGCGPQGLNVIPKSTTLGKTSTGTNIAAVEPYHHVPSTRSSHGQFGPPHQDLKQPAHRNSGGNNGMGVLVGSGASVIHRKSDQYGYLDPSISQRNHYPYPGQQNQKELRTQQQPQPQPSDDYRAQTYGSPHGDEDKKSSPEGSGSHKTPPTEDRLHPEFWPNKFDAKYQTLPSGTKYSNVVGNGPVANTNISRYDYRRPAEGIESTLQSSHDAMASQKFNSSDNNKRLSEDNFNNNNNNSNNNSGSNVSSNSGASGGGSSAVNKDGNQTESVDSSNVGSCTSSNAESTKNQTCNQQSLIQQMNIVRSMPIQSNSNKGLATALSNSNYTPKSTNPNASGRPYEISPYNNYNQSENQSVVPPVTANPTSVTFSNAYQKPVSSVSPIYQTSSTRIQPVQPQIIGSFPMGQNHQNQNHDPRKGYQMNLDGTVNSYHQVSNNNIISDNHITKPALPPKPAAPVKITPPPPPRQSAFHTQFINHDSENDSAATTESKPLNDSGRENSANGENLSHEVESRLAGLELKDKADKKYYGRDTTDSDLMSSNMGSVRGMVNMNLRNGIMFNKDTPPKIVAESPPPLPSVDPPSDEEIEKTTLKSIYVVQNNNDNNNNSESKESNRMHHVPSMSDRLMSDVSQDSSSSDTSSSVENNYFVNTTRRIELPPAYLFPENLSSQRDLIAPNNEKDVDIILNLKNSEQINVDTSSENEKTSLTSLSPDSENNEKMNTYNEELQLNDDIKKIKKGNLKNNNSANNKRRVSFDPLALLLDASLEGELELVMRTASQVKNPSAANDEGITALHNAICAGHFEIVRFLVKFGCDVNAQDSDGWTPLHCAASCNNLPMVRFLVEHGACIFATTLSDQETAAEKCEEDEEGFDGCSEFLYSVQEKLGILNNGVVYAVFDYEAHNADELSFKEGDRLTVLRKGDEWEREWWWSRQTDKEAYVPRNLLGLYPRVHPNTNRIQD